MFNPESYLTILFYRLRQDGFNLSIKEYFAVLDAIKGGWKTENNQAFTRENFKQLLFLLWCNSLEEKDHLLMIFDNIVTESENEDDDKDNHGKTDTPDEERSPTTTTTTTETETNLTTSLASSTTQTIQAEVTKPATQQLSTLPTKSPERKIESTEDIEFQTYYPISRRDMIYSWRYLRRPVADGIKDVLDVPLTISQTAQQGFFLKPVYRRREKNHAHLLILVDQEGSMTPFHRFSQDLIQTAQYESSIERVDVGYFHNLPAEYIYRDRFLTDKIEFEKEVLSQCDSETRVLIVSDAGAARGYRRRERVSATTEVIWEIEQHTNLIAWLNPVPQSRWNSTSAKIISHLVPMFSMNKNGLIQAIGILQR